MYTLDSDTNGTGDTIESADELQAPSTDSMERNEVSETQEMQEILQDVTAFLDRFLRLEWDRNADTVLRNNMKGAKQVYNELSKLNFHESDDPHETFQKAISRITKVIHSSTENASGTVQDNTRVLEKMIQEISNIANTVSQKGKSESMNSTMVQFQKSLEATHEELNRKKGLVEKYARRRRRL